MLRCVSGCGRVGRQSVDNYGKGDDNEDYKKRARVFRPIFEYWY